jgi:hypothetical protein
MASGQQQMGQNQGGQQPNQAQNPYGASYDYNTASQAQFGIYGQQGAGHGAFGGLCGSHLTGDAFQSRGSDFDDGSGFATQRRRRSVFGQQNQNQNQTDQSASGTATQSFGGNAYQTSVLGQTNQYLSALGQQEYQQQQYAQLGQYGGYGGEF